MIMQMMLQLPETLTWDGLKHQWACRELLEDTDVWPEAQRAWTIITSERMCALSCRPEETSTPKR
jgi:hypothetical protein